MISLSPVERARARRRLGLERRVLVSTRRMQREQPQASPELPDWDVLTRRSAALCRRDRARWAVCMDRADTLEAQGVDARAAMHQALDEAAA